MELEVKPYLQNISIQPDADVDFDQYPFNIPVVRELGCLQFHRDVTFFVGENGSGKSTILEAIAIALGFGPEGGTKNVQFQTTNSVSPLHSMLHLSRSYQNPADRISFEQRVSSMSRPTWTKLATLPDMGRSHSTPDRMAKHSLHCSCTN